MGERDGHQGSREGESCHRGATVKDNSVTSAKE